MTTTTSFDLATPRLRFHCRAAGDSDGIPALLLHGSFGSGRWWERFCALLPSEIRAVAPDLRGCGLSEKPDGGYGVAEQAEDVRAMVDGLGWDGFHLMAHSSSGAVAVEFALNWPLLLETLTLVDTVPVEGVFTPLDTYMLLDQMRQDRQLLRAAIVALMPSLPLEDPANRAFVEALVDDAQQMAPAAFTEVARGLAQWNRFADARQLTLPTLLLWGDQDFIVDRQATTRTLIAIPGAANLEVIRGAGHSPMIEAPQTLATRFVDFIIQDFGGFDTIRGSVSAGDE